MKAIFPIAYFAFNLKSQPSHDLEFGEIWNSRGEKAWMWKQFLIWLIAAKLDRLGCACFCVCMWRKRVRRSTVRIKICRSRTQRCHATRRSVEKRVQDAATVLVAAYEFVKLLTGFLVLSSTLSSYFWLALLFIHLLIHPFHFYLTTFTHQIFNSKIITIRKSVYDIFNSNCNSFHNMAKEGGAWVRSYV